MRKIIVFLVFLLFFTCFVNAQCVMPEDGMTVNSDTEFCYGSYNLPEGIIIGADNIALNCNDAVISGNSIKNGILVENRRGVVIKNCVIKNYDVGIYLKNSNNSIISENQISENKFGIGLYSSSGNDVGSNIFKENLRGNIFTYSANATANEEPVEEEKAEEREVIEEETTPRSIIEQVVKIEKPGILDPELSKEIDFMLSRYLNTSEKIIIERNFTYNKEEDKTEIILRIIPNGPFEDLELYEFIPKCIGISLSDIVFGKNYSKVIEKDPLIMWHFEDFEDELSISYNVRKNIPEECRKLFMAIGIGDSKKEIKVTAIILILTIVIAAVIIYFNKHGKNKV